MLGEIIAIYKDENNNKNTHKKTFCVLESFKALFLILSIVSDMGEFHEQITKASGMSQERVIKEIVSREHTQKWQTSECNTREI